MHGARYSVSSWIRKCILFRFSGTWETPTGRTLTSISMPEVTRTLLNTDLEANGLLRKSGQFPTYNVNIPFWKFNTEMTVLLLCFLYVSFSMYLSAKWDKGSVWLSKCQLLPSKHSTKGFSRAYFKRKIF